MEKLKNEYEVELQYGDTTCPLCMKNRFWLAFYNDKTLLVCRDCGYQDEI